MDVSPFSLLQAFFSFAIRIFSIFQEIFVVHVRVLIGSAYNRNMYIISNASDNSIQAIHIANAMNEQFKLKTNLPAK